MRSKEAGIGSCSTRTHGAQLTLGFTHVNTGRHTCRDTHTYATSHWLSGSEHLCEHPIPEAEETGRWRVTPRG